MLTDDNDVVFAQSNSTVIGAALLGAAVLCGLFWLNTATVLYALGMQWHLETCQGSTPMLRLWLCCLVAVFVCPPTLLLRGMFARAPAAVYTFLATFPKTRPCALVRRWLCVVGLGPPMLFAAAGVAVTWAAPVLVQNSLLCFAVRTNAWTLLVSCSAVLLMTTCTCRRNA